MFCFVFLFGWGVDYLLATTDLPSFPPRDPTKSSPPTPPKVMNADWSLKWRRLCFRILWVDTEIFPFTKKRKPTLVKIVEDDRFNTFRFIYYSSFMINEWQMRQYQICHPLPRTKRFFSCETCVYIIDRHLWKTLTQKYNKLDVFR